MSLSIMPSPDLAYYEAGEVMVWEAVCDSHATHITIQTSYLINGTAIERLRGMLLGVEAKTKLGSWARWDNCLLVSYTDYQIQFKQEHQQ